MDRLGATEQTARQSNGGTACIRPKWKWGWHSCPLLAWSKALASACPRRARARACISNTVPKHGPRAHLSSPQAWTSQPRWATNASQAKGSRHLALAGPVQSWAACTSAGPALSQGIPAWWTPSTSLTQEAAGLTAQGHTCNASPGRCQQRRAGCQLRIFGRRPCLHCMPALLPRTCTRNDTMSGTAPMDQHQPACKHASPSPSSVCRRAVCHMVCITHHPCRAFQWCLQNVSLCKRPMGGPDAGAWTGI